MSDIWVTSDTHFGHRNIIDFCSRPFKNVSEMDEALIEKWNSVVKPGDKIYHLGDVYMGSGENAWNLLKRLNGKKRLILGNHDDGLGQIERHFFQKIDVWRLFSEHALLLTHVPVHQSTLHENRFKSDYVWQNIHGHIHTNPSPSGPYRCVCVEQTDYTPVHIEDLRIKK